MPWIPRLLLTHDVLYFRTSVTDHMSYFHMTFHHVILDFARKCQHYEMRSPVALQYLWASMFANYFLIDELTYSFRRCFLKSLCYGPLSKVIHRCYYVAISSSGNS